MGNNDMVRLTKDRLDQKEGFESLVFWRLRIADKTLDFRGFYPSFFVSNLGCFRNEIENRTDHWQEKDGIAYFDGIFVAKARPGDYEIQKIHLPLGSSSTGGVYTALKTTNTFFDIKIDKSLKVPPGKCVYLGEFNIDFLKKENVPKKGIVYTYDVKTNQTNKDYLEALKVVQERFPDSYNQLKKNACMADYYLFYENFNLFSYKRGWSNQENGINSNAYISNGQYIVESKQSNLCPLHGIRPGFKLPQNYDIELTSTWKSGIKSSAYGVVFGIDPNNYYFFAVSGNGAAKVYLFQNAKLQKDPIKWKQNIAKNGDGEIKNIHRVKVRNNAFIYYVNDEEIGTFNNHIKLDNWFVGVSACNQQKISFDNLKFIQH